MAIVYLKILARKRAAGAILNYKANAGVLT